jgi:hypothetical protein
MGEPTDIAHFGHRYQVLVKNNETSEEVVADRVQSIEPRLTANLEKAYELGNPSAVGTATDPPEFTVVIEENLHNSEVDLVLAGKDPTSGSVYNAADFVTNDDIYVYLLARNNAGTVINELEYGGGVTAEIASRFQVGAPCTTTFSINSKTGKLYTSGSVIHSSWGAFDTTSPGIIKGKDARITLGGTDIDTYRTWRLQNFTVRLVFPIESASELGTRTLVGQLPGPPDVTVDFELLSADKQPADVLFPLTSGYYDFSNPNEISQATIRLYDPDEDQESANVLKAWVLENLRASGGTPIRAQTRGLATTRYSLSVSRETTSGSAGMIVYTAGDVPA